MKVDRILRALVVEDDRTSGLILERVLTGDGHQVVRAANGVEALGRLRNGEFDIILVDWMMPEMDGITLIREVRRLLRNDPVVVMVTAMDSRTAREIALGSGADDFLQKPVNPEYVRDCLYHLWQKKNQPVPTVKGASPEAMLPRTSPPSFKGIGIAASTGGPEAVTKLFQALSPLPDAAYFVVMHGPAWMAESFVTSLQRKTGATVRLGKRGMKVNRGEIAIAPGDHHMTVRGDGRTVRLDQGEKINFVRPAADPMFTSLATAYGRQSIGVVLTGLGRDGTYGALDIVAAGGKVLAQDPDTAIARNMPETIVSAGLAEHVLPIDGLAGVLQDMIKRKVRSAV